MRAANIEGLVAIQPCVAGVAGSKLHAGVESLARMERVDVFSSSMPDREGWLRQAAAHFQVESVPQLMDRLGYLGPAELLSMHMCLYMARPCHPTRSRGRPA